MQEEIDSLHTNHTYKLVKLPKGISNGATQMDVFRLFASARIKNALQRLYAKCLQHPS
jgi:hypothetical protein